MPRKREIPAVDFITLTWGYDQLVIYEPSWCRNVHLEVSSQPRRRSRWEFADDSSDEAYDPCQENDALYERYSLERVGLAGVGFGRLDEVEALPRGVRQLSQPPVAARCLKAFLGLELPAALKVIDTGQPASTIALRVEFEVVYSSTTSLDVNFVFDGLQLYANGRVGRSPYAFRGGKWVKVFRRTLTNSWHRFSFDGDAHDSEPVGKWTDLPQRTFYLQDEHVRTADGMPVRRAVG